MILSPPGNPVGGYRRFEVYFVPSLFNFTTSLKINFKGMQKTNITKLQRNHICELLEKLLQGIKPRTKITYELSS